MPKAESLSHEKRIAGVIISGVKTLLFNRPSNIIGKLEVAKMAAWLMYQIIIQKKAGDLNGTFTNERYGKYFY